MFAFCTAKPYSWVMQTVIETPDYLVDAKALNVTAGERRLIRDYIAQIPDAGDKIKGTGGVRKIHFSGCGNGKRRGGIVVAFYARKNIPVFLLSLFSKRSVVDLTNTQKIELKTVVKTLKEALFSMNHDSIASA